MIKDKIGLKLFMEIFISKSFKQIKTNCYVSYQKNVNFSCMILKISATII